MRAKIENPHFKIFAREKPPGSMIMHSSARSWNRTAKAKRGTSGPHRIGKSSWRAFGWIGNHRKHEKFLPGAKCFSGTGNGLRTNNGRRSNPTPKSAVSPSWVTSHLGLVTTVRTFFHGQTN